MEKKFYEALPPEVALFVGAILSASAFLLLILKIFKEIRETPKSMRSGVIATILIALTFFSFLYARAAVKSKTAAFQDKQDELEDDKRELSEELDEQRTLVAELEDISARTAADRDELIASRDDLLAERVYWDTALGELSFIKGQLNFATDKIDELTSVRSEAEDLASIERRDAEELAATIQQDLNLAGAMVSRRSDNSVAIRIENTGLFIGNLSDLSGLGKRILTDISEFIGAYDDYDIRVEGHIGNTRHSPTPHSPVLVGKDPDGKDSTDTWHESVATALSVVRYMSNQGIDVDRLSVVGFGNVKPIDSSNIVGIGMNNRIEVVLTLR